MLKVLRGRIRFKDGVGWKASTIQCQKSGKTYTIELDIAIEGKTFPLIIDFCEERAIASIMLTDKGLAKENA